MCAEKMPRIDVVQRRAQVAIQYGQGVSRKEMAERNAVSVGTIHNDIKAIRQNWIESPIYQYHIVKTRELERIDRIEAAAWEAWEQSCQDEEMTRVTTDGEKQKAERMSRKRAGDPRFLDRITWCVNKRCEILGLDQPAPLPSKDSDDDDILVDERRAELVELLDRLRQRTRIEVVSQAAPKIEADG